MLFFLIILAIFTQFITAQEWTPDFYVSGAEGKTPQFIHAIKEIHKLQLQGTEAVLDIGCGDGATSAYIVQKFLPQGTIHGIDISETMINAAKQHYSSSKISFEKVSLLYYSPSQLYDAVVCFWVLFLFDDYATALKSVMACLRPGGKALICHIIHPGTPFFQLFKKTIEPEQIPVTLPTLDTVLSAIKETSVAIDYLEIKYNYDKYCHFNELMTAMRNIPFFNLLPQEKEALFERELTHYYQSASDGYVYDYSHIVCMVLEKQ